MWAARRRLTRAVIAAAPEGVEAAGLASRMSAFFAAHDGQPVSAKLVEALAADLRGGRRNAA